MLTHALIRALTCALAHVAASARARARDGHACANSRARLEQSRLHAHETHVHQLFNELGQAARQRPCASPSHVGSRKECRSQQFSPLFAVRGMRPIHAIDAVTAKPIGIDEPVRHIAGTECCDVTQNPHRQLGNVEYDVLQCKPGTPPSECVQIDTNVQVNAPRAAVGGTIVYTRLPTNA
eukprot:6191804-Pleurochrysis_carterae.AAC.1